MTFFFIVSLVLFYMHISIYVGLDNIFQIIQACGEPYSMYDTFMYNYISSLKKKSLKGG